MSALKPGVEYFRGDFGGGVVVSYSFDPKKYRPNQLSHSSFRWQGIASVQGLTRYRFRLLAWKQTVFEYLLEKFPKLPHLSDVTQLGRNCFLVTLYERDEITLSIFTRDEIDEAEALLKKKAE